MNDKIWEQKFAELARASGMNKMSKEMNDRLMAAFHEHSRSRPTRLQRLVASLSFDSFAQLLPQGARDVQFAQTRQLFYLCALGDITLDITARGGTLHILGQLFTNEPVSPFEINVLRAGRAIATTTTSKRNLFRFSATEGHADILLSNHTHTVTLKDVPLELMQ